MNQLKIAFSLFSFVLASYLIVCVQSVTSKNLEQPNAYGQVTIYTPPDGVKPSEDYIVRVNGKNVLYDNIRTEDARQKLFDFAIFRSRYSEDGSNSQEKIKCLYLNGAWDGVLPVPAVEKKQQVQFRGHICHITLHNIQITYGLFPFCISYGYDKKHKIKDVVIENLMVHGKKITAVTNAKLYLENTENISII